MISVHNPALCVQVRAELEVSRGYCSQLVQVAREMEKIEARVHAVASTHGVTIELHDY